MKVKEVNTEDHQLERYSKMQQANDVKLEKGLKYYQQGGANFAETAGGESGFNLTQSWHSFV